ncbi:hypothetical protein ColTof4_10895 [Colletotrichum tofieldiae]|nr:hypothetical protein ColTof3_07012 [Colletotrichum tofieldiae]GKT78472.1 hypothetical protein ColTof4_10895 [Colletotrichum tofieldiae]
MSAHDQHRDSANQGDQGAAPGTHERISSLRKRIAEKDTIIHRLNTQLHNTIAEKDAIIDHQNTQLHCNWWFSTIQACLGIDNRAPLDHVLANLQQENEQLRQWNYHYETQIKSFAAKQCQSAKRVDELGKEATAMRNKLSQRKCILIREEKRHKVEMEKHDALISNLGDEIKALKEQLVAKELAESRDRSIANSKKISDDAIRRSWETMSYSIKTIARTLLTHCPPMQDLITQHEGYCCAVARMTHADYEFLQDEATRYLMVQKYIWLSVVSGIFGGGQRNDMQKTWASGSGRDFFALFQSLHVWMIESVPGEYAAELCRWKAESSDMIERIVGGEEWASVFTKAEFSGFFKLLPKEKQENSTVTQSLFKQLQKVYTNAIELHSIFMKSKACFEVKWVEHFMTRPKVARYYEEWMDVEDSQTELDDKSEVLFDVSPVLLKFGNADGLDYERSVILVKFKVVCN